MSEFQAKYGNVPKILLAPSKEEDLCRAVCMADDMPALLQRAIEKYDGEDLKPDGERAVRNARLFLLEYNKLHRQFSGSLEELYEMTGLEILDIGYDDD